MKYISLILCTGFFLFLTPSLKAQKDSVKNELNETNDWPTCGATGVKMQN
jgi:hypothetical protein